MDKCFKKGYILFFPHNFMVFSRFGACRLQVSLSLKKIKISERLDGFYGMFFTYKGYKTSSMKTTIKESTPNEMYEGFHLMGTIVLVLLFLALVAGSFYMFVENYY